MPRSHVSAQPTLKPKPQQQQIQAQRESTVKPLTFKPRAQSTPPPPVPSSSSVRRFRRPALYGIAGASFLLAFYPAFSYLTYRREADRLKASPPPPDTSFRYNSCAETFDDSVDWSEWLLGITNLRRSLLAQATGHVLEASVGTGRNAKYYPLTRGVKTITMVDQSSEMIRVARMNWAKTNAYFIHAAFRIQSAADPVPFPAAVQAEGRGAADGGFDTVVQTMGVCSTGDPVGVLRNLGRMCKPSGRILLLEHGMGKYAWVNRILDEIAPVHAERWGCWFNKDVAAIVRDSGLEVVEQRRYHFGTTYWFVLKPPADRSTLDVHGQRKEDPPLAGPDLSGKPWWYRWWREAN